MPITGIRPMPRPMRAAAISKFYDGSDAIIGARVYSEAADFIAPVTGTPKSWSAAVPTNTRKIRFGLVGTAQQRDQSQFLHRQDQPDS